MTSSNSEFFLLPCFLHVCPQPARYYFDIIILVVVSKIYWRKLSRKNWPLISILSAAAAVGLCKFCSSSVPTERPWGLRLWIAVSSLRVVKDVLGLSKCLYSVEPSRPGDRCKTICSRRIVKFETVLTSGDNERSTKQRPYKAGEAINVNVRKSAEKYEM